MTVANPLKRHSLEWATRLVGAVISAMSWAWIPRRLKTICSDNAIVCC